MRRCFSCVVFCPPSRMSAIPPILVRPPYSAPLDIGASIWKHKPTAPFSRPPFLCLHRSRPKPLLSLPARPPIPDRYIYLRRQAVDLVVFWLVLYIARTVGFCSQPLAPVAYSRAHPCTYPTVTVKPYDARPRLQHPKNIQTKEAAFSERAPCVQWLLHSLLP